MCFTIISDFFYSKFMNNNNNFILDLKIPFWLKSVFMLVEQPLQKHEKWVFKLPRLLI